MVVGTKEEKEERESKEVQQKEKVVVLSNNLKTSYQDNNLPLEVWSDLGGQIQFRNEGLKLKRIIPQVMLLAFQQQQQNQWMLTTTTIQQIKKTISFQEVTVKEEAT